MSSEHVAALLAGDADAIAARFECREERLRFAEARRKLLGAAFGRADPADEALRLTPSRRISRQRAPNRREDNRGWEC